MSDKKTKLQQYSAKWYLANKPSLLKAAKIRYEKNKELRKIQAAEWYAKNHGRKIITNKLWKEKNKLRHADSVRKWGIEHPEKIKEIQARSRIKRKGRRNAASTAYRLNFPEKVKRMRADYRKNNPAKCASYGAQRRAVSKMATPKWANKFFMEEAYDLARRRTKSFGYPWHVDHIVPLNSKIVCGLHSHTNLCVIPAVHNLSKHNSHWPDMPT